MQRTAQDMGLSHEQVNRLFNIACEKLNPDRNINRREWWIFKRVLGKRTAGRHLGRFLRDVLTCPERVVIFCQRIANKQCAR